MARHPSGASFTGIYIFRDIAEIARRNIDGNNISFTIRYALVKLANPNMTDKEAREHAELGGKDSDNKND